MQTFRFFVSYKRHVYRKHSEALEVKQQLQENVPVETAQSSVGAAEGTLSTQEGEEEIHNEGAPCESADVPSDYVRHLSIMFLKWKEVRRLPESTLNEIANDVITFVTTVLEDDKLNGEMSSSQRGAYKDQLCGLMTECGRYTYWKNHFALVEPRTVMLGESNGKRDTMEYVPLCDVLKCILEHPHLSGDFNSDVKIPDHMCSVFDGSAFKKHPFFAGDESKICLQLYTDEFEVCNPLGSKRGKHKLTAVYFSVLNLGVQYRSALSGINLVLLVKDKHVCTYGFTKVLAPLLDDLAILENDGIVANGRLMKGSVFILTGDNLSSHRIGGFKASFNQGRICRFCLALRHEVNYKHLETDFVMRTPEGHQHHLNMLKAGLPTASLYGVKDASPLLALQGFDPSQHLPPDLMHDLHEGVIPFTLKHIISSLISQGCFSLGQLNKLINEWNYDPCDARNKPEAISKDFLYGKTTIKGSASQVFALFRHLSLFVGDLVPAGSEVWQLYLLLREIVDIIMSHKIPVSYIAYLQRKIHLFCLEFRTLFPSSSFTCKMHYLIHYPSCIEKFGPLVDIWAMRFEAKHQYFKDILRKVHNWKRVSHTLAMRHQFCQCFYFISGDDKSMPVTSGCRSVLYEHLPCCVKEFISQHDLQCTNSFSANCVTVYGRSYRVGCSLVLNVPDDSLPEFVHVCGLFYVDKVLLIMLELLETVRFDEHFHVFVVSTTDKYKVITSFSEFATEPLYIHKHMGRRVISARHSLF